MSIIAITLIISIIVIIPIIVIMCIIAIMSKIILITILWINIGFQWLVEGTLDGLGASVCHIRSGEQEQYTSIPDLIGWDNESPIINTWRPDHNEVQSMTAMDGMERFRRKQIAVCIRNSAANGIITLTKTIFQLAAPTPQHAHVLESSLWAEYMLQCNIPLHQFLSSCTRALSA